MKKLFSILLVLAMLLSLAACGGSEEAPKQTQAPAAGEQAPEAEGPAEAEPVTLRVTYQSWMGGKYDFEAMKANFEANHPGVTVEYNTVDNADVTTNMLQWSQGKTDCDIAIGGGREHAVQYAAKGYIVPFEDDFFTGENAKDKYFASFLELGNIDGTQYMVPFTGEVMFIVCNVDLMKQAGLADENGNIAPVATWDDLYAYAEALSAIEGITPLSIDWGTNFMTYSYLSSLQGLKGSIYEDDGKTIDFTSDAAHEVLNQWVKLVEAGYTPVDTFADMDAGRTNFKAGNVAMLMTAASRWIECQANVGEGNTTVLAIPGTDVNGSLAYIHGAVIPAASTNIELAKQFIVEEMMNDTICQQALNTYGKMSPMLRHYEGLENKDWPAVVEATKAAATTPLYKDFSKLDSEIIIEMQSCLSGDMTVEECLESLAEFISGLDLTTGLN